MLSIILLGLAIGMIVGVTGAGGGILAIPALMYSQHWTITQAAPVGLLAVTGSAFVGAMEGFLRKIVRYRAALWIALLGMPMSSVGLIIAHQIPSHWLTLAFASIMIIVGIRLLLPNSPQETLQYCHIDPATGRFDWTLRTTIILGLLGMTIGFLTGLLGVGGGFLLVPALKKLTDLDMQQVVGTSLLVVALVGGSSILMSVMSGYDFPTAVALPFIIACMIGMLLGRYLSQRLNELTVQRAFAVLVLTVALSLFYQA
jgi:uncharacterized membrane protein YfcA